MKASPPYVIVMQVIHSYRNEGKGVEADPVRIVHYYHRLDGTYLARRDEWEEGHSIDNPSTQQ